MIDKFTCAAVALLFVSAVQAEDYSIRSLSGYGRDIQWTHLNNAGDVAGYKDLTVYVRGTTNTTHVTDNFYTYYVKPTALANDGTVFAMSVRYSSGGFSERVAADGTVSPLPTLPQTGPYPNRGVDSVAAVNSHGVAVGTGSNGNGYTVDHGEYFISDYRAVVYQNGQVTDIGTFGGRNAAATSVNNQGTVVGFAETASGRADAFIYANGQMTALRQNSEAKSINDAGVVAGTSHYSDGGWSRWDTAFLYANGAFTDIAIEGYRSTSVIDLNNAGQVVGRADRAEFGGDYFLYENGQATLLSDLLAQTAGSAGWRMGTVYDINDKGEILIDVYKNDGQLYSERDYWVLTPGVLPVPEPGTWAMLLAGLGAIGLAARRRKARA